MPFLVAVRGSAREERSPKTTNASLSPFGQVPFYERDRRDEVLGFAFLSPWQSDLAGSGSGSSRTTARINIFIHPDYRRKKIGYSLLDMLLTSNSNRFVSETAYDFVDRDNSPMYRKPTDPARERQYYRLYLSYFVKHKHPRLNGGAKLEDQQNESDQELAWVKKLLEDKFCFEEVARFEAAHRSSKCREGPVYWLDEVVFQHTCWYGLNDIKEDY
jgi:GNAT superfamily N-acetyltransferase